MIGGLKMKVAILESIVMPAGHEVEFDRILIEGLKTQGYDPLFFVPEKFPFKFDYKTEVEYFAGGEVVSYAGAGKLEKIWRSFLREKRRIAWFNDAYKKAVQGKCDVIIVPTATYRYLRTLGNSYLKESPVPVIFVFHGINPDEKQKFIKFAKKCEAYPNIKLKIITLRDDFKADKLTNVDLIDPPVFRPWDLNKIKPVEKHQPLKLGFFGQYRREKNLGFFLDAFIQARFTVPVKLIVQGATAKPEDSAAFEKYMKEYSDYEEIEFWHRNLIGKEWHEALLSVDAIIMPYAAERYRYHWSAMLFTAIGFNKPLLQSPEMNPEVLQKFVIGEALDMTSKGAFVRQLEHFVNKFSKNIPIYNEALGKANVLYSQENLIKNIMD